MLLSIQPQIFLSRVKLYKFAIKKNEYILSYMYKEFYLIY